MSIVKVIGNVLGMGNANKLAKMMEEDEKPVIFYDVWQYFIFAARAAEEATCERSRCGAAIISSGGELIGRGFNAPPDGKENQRRCSISKDSYDPNVTDKTCCIHAEQKAIIQALTLNPKKIAGATMYFIRLGEDGKPAYSGMPYCTICSKMCMEVGIERFGLFHEGGPKIYDIEVYNNMSYNYKGKKK